MGECARASKEEIVIWLSNALFAIAKPLGTINDLIALQTHKKSLSCHLRMADKACPPPPPPLLRGKIKSKGAARQEKDFTWRVDDAASLQDKNVHIGRVANPQTHSEVAQIPQ